jgi:hypothetical protein
MKLEHMRAFTENPLVHWKRNGVRLYSEAPVTDEETRLQFERTCKKLRAAQQNARRHYGGSAVVRHSRESIR